MRILGATVFALVVLAAAPGTRAARPPDPVRAAITRAESAKAITPEAAEDYRTVYGSARFQVERLGGLRKRELRSVIHITRDIARRGQLTSSRMPVVFLTLRRNVEWWSEHGPPAALSPGEQGAKHRVCRPLSPRAHAARIQFPGSKVVFQYYPGLGLQLHILATFSTAQALLDFGKDADALQILDEMAGLVSQRGGHLAWEAMFPFGGGRPPWASGMYEATAIRVLAQAGQKLNRPDLIDLARRATPIIGVAPPVGANVRLDKDGSWYALYSFAPGQRVLNAHLQTLVGLYDYAQVTGDPLAQRLYREGLRAARRRIGSFDTGRWSKYANPGAEADLNYHVVNRDEARLVCKRSGEKAICDAAERFSAQLDKRCPKVGRR